MRQSYQLARSTTNCHRATKASGRSILMLAAASALAGLSAQSAWANNKAWSTAPTDGTFSGINWTNNTTTPGIANSVVASADVLYFGSSTTTLLTNDLVGATFGVLTFNSGASAFTIGGNDFSMGGNIVNASTSNQTVNNNLILTANRQVQTQSTSTLTIGGNISGAFGLTLTSNNNNRASFLTLSGSNSYTGNTTMGFCTVQVTNANAIGTGNLTSSNNGNFNNITGGDLTFANGLLWAGGGAFQFNRNTGAGAVTSFGNMTFNGGVNMTASQSTAVINNTVTLAGGVTFGNFRADFGTGDGVSGTSGAFVLAGTNSGTGLVNNISNVSYATTARLTAGIVQVANSSAFGLASGTTSGVVDFRSGILAASAPVTLSNTFVIATGTPNIGGSNNITLSGPIIQSNGASTATTMTITNTGATTIGGSISMTDHPTAIDNQSLNVGVAASAGLVTISGAIQDKTAAAFAGSIGSFIKSGDGTLTLSGTSTYSGTTDIRAGVLQLTGAIASQSINLGNGTGSGKLVLGGASPTNLSITTLTTAGSGTANLIVGGASAVSTLTYTTAATTTFAGGLGGAGTNENNIALSKSGAGTLIINGNNTHNGATVVNGGKLVVNGNISNSDVAVNTGTFDSAGTVKSIAVAAGQTLSQGVGTTGSLNVSNNLNFAGLATLNLVTSSATTSGARLAVGGTLTTAGASNVTLNISSTDAVWANGTYDLISYGSVSGGSLLGLTKNVINNGGRQINTFALSGNLLQMSVSNDSPLWKGLADNKWDTSTVNWILNTGGTTTTFQASDTAIFDATGANTSIDITAANVNPNRIDVNAATYTFSSSTGNGIVNGSSAGKLFVNTGSNVTLNTSNAYTGGTTVTDATLNINNNSAIGTGTLTLAGTTNTLDNTSGSAKTLATNNPIALNTDVVYVGSNPLNMGTGAVTMNAAHTITVSGSSLTLGGPVSGSTGGFTKAGTGTLSLTGSSTVTGTIDVRAGELNLNGGSFGTTGGNLRVAMTTADNAVFSMNNGTIAVSQVSLGGNTSIDVGVTNFATAGTVNQTGGTINSASYIVLGQGASSDGITSPYGEYNISGGTLTLGSNFLEIGSGTGATGVLNVSGTGSVKIYSNRSIHLGEHTNAFDGTVNQTGGSVTFYSDTGATVGGTGSLVLGNAAITGGGPGIHATSTYAYNLSGGTLTVPDISQVTTSGGSGLLNLNGGTLKAAKSTTNWIHGLTHAYVQAGGAVIDDGAFAVSIVQNLEEDPASTGGGLTKQGAGTLTIAGNSSYTGPTLVSGGVLLPTGSINSSSGITVNGVGAKLVNPGTSITPNVTITSGTVDGTGSYGNIAVASNASNLLTHGNGTTAALAVNSVTFSGSAQVSVNISGGTTGINAGSISALGGAGSVLVNASNTGWSLGNTYNLISYSGSLSGFSAFAPGTISGLGIRQSASLTNPSGFIAIAISGDVPVWSGANSNVWKTDTTGTHGPTPNWALKAAHTGTNFWTTDIVEFNDTYNLGAGNVAVTANTVTIQGGVTPAAVAFSNSSVDYTITSSDATGINGASTISKTGTGRVSILTSNSYTGSTTVNAGVLSLQNSSALGSSSNTTIANGAALELSNNITTTARPITISGDGMTASPAGVIHNVGGSNTLAGVVTLGSNALIKSDAGSALVFSNATATGAFVGGGNALTLDGAGDGSIAGPITGVGTTLTKSGTGTWTLAGRYTGAFTGGTTINGGTLKLASGGGTGVLMGAVTINNGGTLLASSGDAIGFSLNQQVTTMTINAGGTFSNTAGNQGYRTQFIMNGGQVTSTGGAINFTDTNEYVGFDKQVISQSGTTSTFAAPVSIRFNSFGVETASGSLLDMSGAIGGGSGSLGTFTKTGDGTLSLAGNSGFNPPLALNAGTIIAASNNALGSTAQGTTVANGATLDVRATSSESVSINGAGFGGVGALVTQVGSGTLAGDLTLAGNSSIGGDGALTVSGQVTGAGITLTKIGPGTTTLSGLTKTASYSGGTIVNAGVLEMNVIPQSSLVVNNSGVAVVTASDADGGGPGIRGSASAVSKLTNLTIGASAKLDLKNNGLIIPAAGNLNGSAITVDTLRAAILAGRGGAGTGAATWSGAGGIGTSVFAFDETYDSIGYVWSGDPNLLVPPTDINGESYDAGDYVVKYCAGADADLNGLVDDTDVAVIGLTYDGGATTGHHWYEGDFNYDGLVNDDDVAIIGLAYNPANTPLSPSFQAALSAEYGSSFASAFASGAGTVVPEPTSLGLLAIGAMGLLRRRRNLH